MPDVTLSWVPFAIGQSVDVYARVSELMLDDQPPPMQPVVATAVVADDKTLSYTALPVGSYWAVASVPPYRYVAFMAQDNALVPV